MSIGIHEAANISEIDPAQVTPEVAVTICHFAKMQLERCARTAIPHSPAETRYEDGLDEIDTISRACQDPGVQAGWDTDGHRRNIHGRLAEIESECYDLVLANLERLEPDNPMRELVQRYQQARIAKEQLGTPSYIIQEG